MARRSRRKPGLLEGLAAVYLAGVTLVGLALHYGLGESTRDSAKLAVVIVAAMLSVSILSFSASLAAQTLRNAGIGKPAKARSSNGKSRKSEVRVPRGLVRRVDRRAGKRIRKHADLLARKRRGAIQIGDLGAVDPVKWKREQDEFIDAVILVDVDPDHAKHLKRRVSLINAWRRRMDAAANDADRKRANAGRGIDFRPGMDGFEYEAYCARVLGGAGWKVYNKGDSGDQGVDLIAERRGVIVAIQCKRYRGSVGNKAVQEIFAGKATVDASAYAAVVTNAEYTRSAKELAAATHVHLLHHDDLPKLADIVSGAATPLAMAA